MYTPNFNVLNFNSKVLTLKLKVSSLSLDSLERWTVDLNTEMNVQGGSKKLLYCDRYFEG